jgi:hypothetical protein
MPKYAKSTTVGSEKSRGDIERALMKYGATGFMYMWKGTDAVIAFEFNRYHVRLNIPMPDKNDAMYTHTLTGRKRKNAEDMLKAWEQASRQRWRAVLLIIKAKLESIDCGIRTFEQEFIGDFVLADGSTVAERLLPDIQTSITAGHMPSLALPGPTNGR